MSAFEAGIAAGMEKVAVTEDWIRRKTLGIPKDMDLESDKAQKIIASRRPTNQAGEALLEQRIGGAKRNVKAHKWMQDMGNRPGAFTPGMPRSYLKQQARALSESSRMMPKYRAYHESLKQLRPPVATTTALAPVAKQPSKLRAMLRMAPRVA